MRRFKPLFYKFNTSLQKTTTCIGLHVEQISFVNIQYLYFFSVLDVAFAARFLCYFQKLQLLVIKKIEIIFSARICIFMSSKSMPQIFKILFQTGDINNFVFFGVFL